jgi:hypothetical protein
LHSDWTMAGRLAKRGLGISLGKVGFGHTAAACHYQRPPLQGKPLQADPSRHHAAGVHQPNNRPAPMPPPRPPPDRLAAPLAGWPRPNKSRGRQRVIPPQPPLPPAVLWHLGDVQRPEREREVRGKAHEPRRARGLRAARGRLAQGRLRVAALQQKPFDPEDPARPFSAVHNVCSGGGLPFMSSESAAAEMPSCGGPPSRAPPTWPHPPWMHHSSLLPCTAAG